MPHGNPKKATAFRIDPELLQSVQATAEAQGTNVTAAVEEGLRLWLARAKRSRAPKGGAVFGTQRTLLKTHRR